jgi:hypothetical protein
MQKQDFDGLEGKNLRVHTFDGSCLIGDVEAVIGELGMAEDSGFSPAILMKADWCAGIMVAIRVSQIDHYELNETKQG